MTSSSTFETRLSLISRVRDAESGAWRDLVELYGPLVRLWCRKQGLDAASVEDCVQEVFLTVSQSLDRFDSEHTGGSFRGWLWTMTKRKMIDMIRREKRQTQADGGSSALEQLNELPDSHVSDEETTSPLVLKQLLHRAMQQVRSEFNPKTWQAFERCVVDGQSTQFVAQELSLTPASVRQYRARILRRLRRQLGDQ